MREASHRRSSVRVVGAYSGVNRSILDEYSPFHPAMKRFQIYGIVLPVDIVSYHSILNQNIRSSTLNLKPERAVASKKKSYQVVQVAIEASFQCNLYVVGTNFVLFIGIAPLQKLYGFVSSFA